jgi:hypothetical protein
LVEDSGERVGIGPIDGRVHRLRDPREGWRRRLGLLVAAGQCLRDEFGDELAQRPALLVPERLELAQNRRLDVNRRTGHDAMMITIGTS